MFKQERSKLDTYYNTLYAKINEYNSILSQLARQTREEPSVENNAKLENMYNRFVGINDSVMDTTTSVTRVFRRMFPNKNLEKQRYSISGAIENLPIGRLIEMTHPKIEEKQDVSQEEEKSKDVTTEEQSGARRLKGKVRKQVKRTIRRRIKKASQSKKERITRRRR